MVVSVVLARILSPNDYGVIAFTSIFIHLSDILIQAGFATALIRKPTADYRDYSTVMGISIIMAMLLYILIFVSAPLISSFYDEPLLTKILRVIALSLFFQAFVSVRTAIISRHMKFRILFICSIIANILSGIIGIFLAVAGTGVWALVFQQLTQQLILTVALFMVIKVKFDFRIYKDSAKTLVPFSIKVLISSLLSFIGSSFYNLVIGKTHSMEDLGYYEKGGLFPQNISLYTFNAVSSVFLPVFSSVQNDKRKLNDIFQRVLNVSMFIILPMMAGLCMTAEPLITVVLTDKWLPSVNIMRWMCLYYVMTPLLLAHVQLHFAIGRSNTRIKVETYGLLAKIIAMAVLIYLKSSVVVISAIVAIIQVFSGIYISFETVKAINFDLKQFIKNLLPTCAAVLIMCAAVFLISLVDTCAVIKLVVEVFAGITVYTLVSFLLKNRAYFEVKELLKSLLDRRK